MNIETTNDILELIAKIVTVGGFIVTSWKFFFKKILYHYILNPIKIHFEMISKMADTVDIINVDILPVIQSLSKEFSKNSGKSIMDRILRIDDNTRLAELRSKLIASNLVSTGMVEFDKNGGLVWANSAILSMSGLDNDHLIGNGWLVTIEEDERDHVWTLWQSSIKNNIPFESEFVMKNQISYELMDVKCSIYPHKSVDGTILGYYGSIIRLNY
jgi:PAS domain-containing protein